MERWLAKVLALITLFTLVLTATLLPIKVTKYFIRHGRRGQIILSYLMCFGGGAFLSTYTIHMAPDVREIMYHAVLKPWGINYPIADLMIISGLFGMLLLGKCLEKANKPKRDAHPRHHDVNSLVEKAGVNDQVVVDWTIMNQDNVSLQKSDGSTKAEMTDKLSVSASEGSMRHVSGTAGTRSLLLLLALSFDHIFEGMSVGLKHSVTSVWNLTFAIIAHEVVIAFSLGMRLVYSYNSHKKVFAAALLCSAMEPLGVVIGMILIEVGEANSPGLLILNGVLQSLSTGVFMYTTFFEILPDELKGNSSITRLCFIVAGFAVLALMDLIPQDRPAVPTATIIANNNTLIWNTTAMTSSVNGT